MALLIEVVMPVFLVIGFGYVAVWRKYLSEIQLDGLMKFTMKFAIPCLLFDAMVGIDLTADFDMDLLASYYVSAGIVFLVGILGGRFVFKRTLADSVAIGFACLFANSLLLGLAITERAFGTDALAANYVLISVHAPFCYFLGITTMEIVRNNGKTGIDTLKRVTRAMFSNTLIVGIVAGLGYNLSGLPLPQPIEEAVGLMSRAALPIALFGLGGVLVQFRPEGDMRAILFVIAVSLILHPALVWGFGTVLDLPPEAFRSAVLTAAMAPGMNAYLFADMYGSARRVAASSVLGATALSVLSVWVWLQLLP